MSVASANFQFSSRTSCFCNIKNEHPIFQMLTVLSIAQLWKCLFVQVVGEHSEGVQSIKKGVESILNLKESLVQP